MKPKEIKSFHDEYRDHCQSGGRRIREVNDKDLLILADYKKGMMLSELRDKYKMSYFKIGTSLKVAALSKV